jgi:hypothetical protein
MSLLSFIMVVLTLMWFGKAPNLPRAFAALGSTIIDLIAIGVCLP